MGTAMAVAGVVGIVGMAGNVASAGVSAGMNADDIRKNIADVKEQTGKFKQEFEAIDAKEAKVSADAQQQIQANLNASIKAAKNAAAAKVEYAAQYKKIQMSGVIFLCVIFFLLLLKETGVVDAMEDLVMGIFKHKPKGAASS
jgi:hypothetical protein